MNRRFLLWIVGLAALALFAGLSSRRTPPKASPGQSTGEAPLTAPIATKPSLEVRVRSRGAPVARAKVGLALGDDRVASGYTDERGELTFRELSPGKLRLIVAHSRHVRHERSVAIEASSTRVEIELSGAAVLRARVLDTRGAAVEGASVKLGAGTHELGRCETAADGVCEIGELEPGKLAVVVHSGRHRTLSTEIALAPSETPVEHSFTLAQGSTLSGRVVDERGAAVPGAKVGSNDESGGFSTADSEGRFELAGLGTSPVNVFATAEGFAPRHLRAVRPGSLNLELRLERPASVGASVVTEGTPASLLASVCEYDTHFAREVCVARRHYAPVEPRIAIEGLPSGSFDLVLEAEGHLSARVRVTLSPGMRTNAGEVKLRAQR